MTEDQAKEEERKRKARIRSARWVAKNLERVREINRVSYHRHKEKREAFRNANKDKKAAQDRAYYVRNAERLREKSKKFHAENREKCKERSRQYYRDNKAKCMESIRQRRAWRMANDPAYRISVRTRCAVNRLIKMGWKKNRKSSELIGCSWEQARAHLESKFLPGMTWENHGMHGWHIDHIRPICSFNVLDEKELMAAFHYTNLQPLWAKDNHSKGGRYQSAA